jgi:WD40 repeat protein
MGAVADVRFSPDGRRLASASQDASVRVWDAATGQEMLALREHTHRVLALAFSPDGRRLASASWDGTVRVWDAALRPKALTLEGHAARVTCLAVSPDGGLIASASQDGTARIWDAASGQSLCTLTGHTGWVLGVAFSPDGRRLASAGQDQTLRLWDVESGRHLCSFTGHTDQVLGVAFSPPDGRWLASAGLDGTLRLWSVATGEQTLALPARAGGRFPELPYKPAFSPDGCQLAAPGPDNCVNVWDIATGRQLLSKGHSSQVLSVAFSPDGKHVASAGDDQTVMVWDAVTGEATLSLQVPSGAVLTVAFSPDGRRLAAAGGDPTVRLWDVATRQELLTLQGQTPGVRDIAFSPDGRRLLSAAGIDGTVQVWDGTELTPPPRIDWEARGLVQWLLGKPLPHEEVAAALRRDPTITEPVRQQALVWVERFGRIQVRAEAARVVRPLFAKPLLRAEVLATLQADARLSPAVRREALALAKAFPEDAHALNVASSAVVHKPGAGASANQRALRQAEAACDIVPNSPTFLNTRGIACYRLGKYEEALETLARCTKLRTAPNPSDLAFLAMAHHQLGQGQQAQATFTRLREVMRQHQWAADAPAQGFLREAEELLKARPANGKE